MSSASSAFAALLDSGDLKAYAEATQQITKEFGEVSQAIRHVEDSLNSLTPPWPMAGKIRQLQELERSKLSLVRTMGDVVLLQYVRGCLLTQNFAFSDFRVADFEKGAPRSFGSLRGIRRG
jgi:hypothetical protein